MAVNASAADEEQSETTNVQKDVTIIAYADAGGQVDERGFASEFDPEGRDFEEREENTRTSHYVRHYNSDENEWQEEYISEDAYEVLFEKGGFDPENDANVELKRDVDHRVDYAHRPKEAVEAVVNAAFESLEDDELPALEDFRLKAYGPKIQDRNTWEDIVTFTPGRVNSQKVLTHQAEREEGNRFEDDTGRQAFSLTINMDADEETIDTLSNTVVPNIMSFISKLEGVGKVRLSDCKKRVETEGDCFNAL